MGLFANRIKQKVLGKKMTENQIEIKKEDLSGILDVYKMKDTWFVDFKHGIYEGDSENIGMSDNSENEALKFALVNLAVERIKNDESMQMIDELNRKFNSYDFDQRYKDLKKPTMEVVYEIEME